MRVPLYRLLEGPEWQQSVEDADTGDQRFQDNLAALRMALEYGPYKYSQPLVEEHDKTRIATTKDVAAGYRLVAGVQMDTPNVILGWLDLEWLEEGGGGESD